MKKLLALLLAVVMVLGIVACTPATPTEPSGTTPKPTTPTQGKDDPTNPSVTPVVLKQAEYDRYTSTMPSNWNQLTYQDNNDTQILNYIVSEFFTYDYKFENDEKYNADGSINKDAIVEGAYTTNYDAATKIEDVTATVDAKWGYTDEQKAEGGYAWKITLRTDLKWDDGTPITAADFEYSMQEILNPLFMNYRANTYYETLRIKGSKAYFYQNQEATYPEVGAQGYENNAAAIEAGQTLYWDCYDFWGASGYVDAEGNPCPQWLAMDDETVYDTPNAWVTGEAEDAFSGKAIFDAYFTPGTGAYAGYVEVGGSYSYWLAVKVVNEDRDVSWDRVGCYAIPEENAIVICLEKTYAFVNADGELTVWAPYYMSGLPLVKKDLYESCKIAPENGATLWTSNYNSSLETTASWGPYKLVEFEAGSHFRLEKNENWFGYGMEEYKNQYNLTAINTRKVAESTTQWLGFLAGEFDKAALSSDNYADYQDSKYVYYTSTSSGTYGMQLYSDLNTLKNSENNNGILAILEFRQALNLGLNRSDVVEKIWPGSVVPCFGLVNPAYYYDVENAPYLDDGGSYRNTTIAKEGILRAYGYVQAADGTWSTGALTGMDTEEAYETLTGYNPTLAKQKMAEAIAILTANAEEYGYDSTKNITLVYGASTDTDKQRFRAQYLQDIIDGLTVGTALEDKIDVVFDASAGSKWSDAFRSGATQIGFGYGFSGNPFNPFNIIGAFVDPDDSLNYHMYWNTGVIDMTLTMPAGDYAGAGETITMSVQNWFKCLNGLAEVDGMPVVYNWDAGYAPVEARLVILSALEELTIKESRSVMLIADGGGEFLGAQFSYITDVENTFMGFGSYRYMEVNYTDAEWAAFVAANNNDLSEIYKQSE